MNKKVRSLEYQDLLLCKCKEHGGPFVNLPEIRNYVNKEGKHQKLLRMNLRQEIGFRKLLHPVDAKERPHLYKMNDLTCEQLVENLTILIDNTIETNDGEVVLFPSEDEIMDIIQEQSTVEEQSTGFKPQQPLAVAWSNDDGSSYWSIGFFMCDVEDECIQVDHLKLKSGHENDKL